MLSVILPAYQESDNLKFILPELKEVLNSLGEVYQIIVVDTNVPLDETFKVCLEHQVEHVKRTPTNSYGDAIRSGISNASGDRILIMDADGSHAPSFIIKLYDKSSKSSLVIASRYVNGGSSDNPLILQLMSRIVNLTYRFFLGVKCCDVSNSFRLYDANALKNLNLRSSDFDIVEEILVKLIRDDSKIVIIEVPYHFNNRKYGKTKRNLVKFFFSYVSTLIKLKFVY